MAPRVIGYGLLSKGTATQGAALFGVDVDAEGAVQPLKANEIRGNWATLLLPIDADETAVMERIVVRIADLAPEVEQRLVRIAKRVYRGLSLSGYGRIDFRLTEDGRPFLIEANPNCDLGYGEELHESAKAAGMTYESLLQRILNLGLGYQAEWRQEI